MHNKAIKQTNLEVGGWHFDVDIGEDWILITPNEPSQAIIRFETTFCKGGDGGHGGMARLKVFNGEDGFANEFRVSQNGATITSKGDFELKGLAISLALLGQTILTEGFHLK